MPGHDHGPSIKKPRVYEALRRRGMSKSQAAAISNAMAHKAANWGARAGQTIAGNLTRASDGKFSSGGAAPTPRQQRAQDRTQSRAQRRTDAAAARDTAARSEDAQRATEDAYVATGKTPKERALRRRAVAQARAQRVRDRREAQRQAGEQERATRAQETAAEQQARAAEAAAAAEKPKGGGGGGGKAKPSDEQKRAEADQKKQQTARQTASQVGLAPADVDALSAAARGQLGAEDVAGLTKLGLVGADGLTTDAGRRALGALERGDVRGYQAAVQDARAAQDRAGARAGREQAQRMAAVARQQAQAQRDQERRDQAASRDQAQRERRGTLVQQALANLNQTRKAQQTFGGTMRADLPDAAFAGPGRSFPIRTAQDVRDAVRSLGRTKHDPARIRRGIIRRARAIGATSALPAGWKAFAVHKDAAGRDRWVAISSTAYRDRDREIVSTQALRDALAAQPPTGPLRFWHVPGLDLGTCDWQALAQGGRFLVESGTLRDAPAAAIARKAAAAGYQMSIGFVHPPTEPDAQGVFSHIRIFERSLVPPGRAANPYTRFTAKETRMTVPAEKIAEFKALGGTDELLAALLGSVAQTDKAAQDAGVAFKDDAPPAWAQALVTRIDALETALKAAPPPPPEEAESAAEPMDDMGHEDADQDAAMIQSLVQEIVSGVVQAIGPMLDLEKKMSGYLGEMKTMLGGAQQAAVAKDDARAQEIATLTARLAALEGDVPRGARGAGVGIPLLDAVQQTLKAAQGEAGAVASVTGDPAAAADPLSAFLTGFHLNGRG